MSLDLDLIFPISAGGLLPVGILEISTAFFPRSVACLIRAQSANQSQAQAAASFERLSRSQRIIIASIDRRQAWHELAPRRQIFVRSQQAWVNDLNSIPKFDGMPPR